MTQMLKANGSATISGSMIRRSFSISNDMIRCYSEYIEEEYRSSDSGDFVGSFVDAYDLFAAGIGIICLQRASSISVDMKIINKCTALLTLLGERFPGLRVFRRVLWAFSDVASVGQELDPLLENLPEAIPDGIGCLISRSL